MIDAPPGAQLDDPYAGGAYPTVANDFVQKEVKNQTKAEKAATRKAALNMIEPLRDNPDRQRFVIKTYAIVATQLIFTAGCVAIVFSDESYKDWFEDHDYLYYVFAVVGCVLLFTLICC